MCVLQSRNRGGHCRDRRFVTDIMRASITDYLTYLRTERNYSSHTVVAYEEDLTQFFEFLKLHFATASVNLRNIDHLTIRNNIVILTLPNSDAGFNPIPAHSTISHNIYFGPSQLFYWGGTSYSSFSAWASASGDTDSRCTATPAHRSKSRAAAADCLS